MPEAAAFALPAIDDADIAWVCAVMGLPQTAFAGPNGTDPRLGVLKSLMSSDIEACPGSGKTTLLVAKLAILANKWRHLGRGICVLSHTNAARREIEKKLGSSSVGNALLRYPHYVGTIHSFVNEFLAVPWLRSQEIAIKAIDDDIALNIRWAALSVAIRSGLDRQRHDKQSLRYVDAGFVPKPISWGRGTLQAGNTTYEAIRSACQQATLGGYLCHDEMFVWGNKLLDVDASMTEVIRHRFPLLFIDEVQDNSEQQSALLHRVFLAGERPVVRQRLGDSNQAIYSRYDAEDDAARTDPFPDAALKVDLPNSFRFGPAIATDADPFAVVPQSLVGQGPPPTGIATRDRRNAIFLFDDASIQSVLAHYAAYLRESFAEEDLHQGRFTAVAAVHKVKESDKLPHYLGHYAPGYSAEVARKEPSPKLLSEYIDHGRRELAATGLSYSLVCNVAAALLRLAQLADPAYQVTARRNSHRAVLELLADHDDARRAYVKLIDQLARWRGELTRRRWDKIVLPRVERACEAMIGMVPNNAACMAFLAWNAAGAATPAPSPAASKDNIFRYPADNPSVQIHLSSIHAVKGETHTATLVLESFHRTHHLKALKRWILGKKAGGANEDGPLQARLRLHYVAMSRPSHLLCLAIRRDAFTEKEIPALEARGWKVIDCAAAFVSAEQPSEIIPREEVPPADNAAA